MKFIEDSINLLIEERKKYGFFKELPKWKSLKFEITINQENNTVELISEFVYKKGHKEYKLPYVRMRYDISVKKESMESALLWFSNHIFRTLIFGKNALGFKEIFEGKAKFGFHIDAKTFNEQIENK